MDCARKTIAVDGIGALWKGFGPAMARAFPANAATFVSLILNVVHCSFMFCSPNTILVFTNLLHRHFAESQLYSSVSRPREKFWTAFSEF